MKIKVNKKIMFILLIIFSIIAINHQTFAATSSRELKSVSSAMFGPAIVAGVFWVAVIYLIVRKIKNGKQLKNMVKEEKEQYYKEVSKMSREEQFEALSEKVKNILHEGYQRNQGNLSKRIALILQIKTCPIKYKSLSAFKKEGYQDIIKTNNPYELIGFSKIYPDGRVECIAMPNIIKMSTENANRLSYINTGDENTPLYPMAYSELIKNNPNIDVVELIKTLESRC